MIGPFEADKAATPLEPAEREGLIATHVTVHEELNELEQQNILAADLWAFERKRDVIDEDFLLNLHKRMFGDVWKWTGTYRKTDRNLGVPPYRIQPGLHEVLGNIRYWVEHETYPADEIAVRFHHDLVVVHPFPNGNGRWSRMAGDLLAVRLGRDRFTWGAADLRAQGDPRSRYLAALRAADLHDFTPLIGFARS